MEHEDQSSPKDAQYTQQVNTNGGTVVAGDVDTKGGDFVGRDKNIYIGSFKIPKTIVWIVILLIIAVIGISGYNAWNTSRISTALTDPTATPLPTITPLAFATESADETLIVIAAFHNTAATNSEPHIKIRRSMTDEASKLGDEKLRIEVDEQAELTADQRVEAESLGKRYNASMIIWGEDTGVEVIVNFLNLKEPNLDAADTTIRETERTQLANPSAYARFVTGDLPRTMNFLVFFSLGQSYYLTSNYSLAIARIEHAVDLVPNNARLTGLAEAYFRLGWLYNHSSLQGHLIKTLNYYNKAIDLDSQASGFRNNRGLVYFELKQYSQALADFSKSIELQPDYFKPYANRANVYVEMGKFDQAVADYDSATRLEQNNPDIINDRGLAYLSSGKYQQAITDFSKAIDLDPKFADAYNNRSLAYLKLGDHEQANIDLRKAASLSTTLSVANADLGNAKNVEANKSSAAPEITANIQPSPKNWESNGASYGSGLLFVLIITMVSFVSLSALYSKLGKRYE